MIRLDSFFRPSFSCRQHSIGRSEIKRRRLDDVRRGSKTVIARREGIGELLERLNSSRNVPLPDGVTPETLLRYREIAEQAIRSGKDTLGVQAKRIEAIDELLRRSGGR